MPSLLAQHAPHCTCSAHAVSDADLAVLDALTAPSMQLATINRYKRRDAPLDPLLFAAATMSGPHVTRHHYHHGFSVADAGVLLDDPAPVVEEQRRAKPRYESKQAPRRERLGVLDENKENIGATRGSSTSPPKRRNTVAADSSLYLSAPERPLTLTPSALHPAPVEVQCMVRTRIPTAHGEVFLHLYRNNRDSKEHLAVVFDPAQLGTQTAHAPFIRSRSLDAVWGTSETEMDRIVRGAYTGRLGPTRTAAPAVDLATDLPPPLIRIHSECFTGETIGSMRCDCGEQLDEALRRIAVPVAPGVPGRGAVLYLRQEGRGIGLLSKLRAYNLQDMGHDTVSANLALGHRADERRYDVAGAILRDLGLADGVRILTNNPDKIHALAAEGVNVVERVEMVPRAWTHTDSSELGRAPHGEDLDRYLHTKVARMGHMLQLPEAKPAA